MSLPQKITRVLKYEYSTEELEEMATTVFENIDQVQKLKIEKKESNKAFGDRIKTLEETNVEYGHKIQNGFEYTDIACEVHFNTPTDGKKTIIRTDDNTIVEVVDMLPDENTIERLRVNVPAYASSEE